MRLGGETLITICLKHLLLVVLHHLSELRMRRPYAETLRSTCEQDTLSSRVFA